MNTEHRSGSAGARWMLIAALVLLAAGSFYFFGYRPEMEKSANLASDHEAKQLFLQKTQAIVEAKRADAAASDALADTAKREAAVPEEPDREGILLDLERAAKSSGVQIREVVFEGPESGGSFAVSADAAAVDNSLSLDGSVSILNSLPAGSSSTDGVPSALGASGLLNEAELSTAGFTVMSLQLQLRGSLAEVKNFAAALQKADRLYIVDSFEYGREEEVESKTAAFRLLALYR
ncbi:hypothetical protein ACTNDP_09190 [Paenibacillus barengoltzii]|jgi:hypothetical protein|uniref:hypothetical protein n=1 Tax=Paenibacillus barengoltzii TaxID=343517 RepID=UPI003F8AB0D5